MRPDFDVSKMDEESLRDIPLIIDDQQKETILAIVENPFFDATTQFGVLLGAAIEFNAVDAFVTLINRADCLPNATVRIRRTWSAEHWNPGELYALHPVGHLVVDDERFESAKDMLKMLLDHEKCDLR